MDRKNVVCHLTLNRTKPIKLKQSIFNNESMFKCIMYLKNKVYLFPLFARIPVTDDQLEEVAIESGVLNVPDDYLTPEFREECERIVDVKHLQPSDCKEAFLFIKQHFRNE